MNPRIVVSNAWTIMRPLIIYLFENYNDLVLVISANEGIQPFLNPLWIPACAGMTEKGSFFKELNCYHFRFEIFILPLTFGF